MSEEEDWYKIDPGEYYEAFTPTPEKTWKGDEIVSEEDLPLEQIRCKICGGTCFEVAQAYVYTAIRCPKCGNEECIHEG